MQLAIEEPSLASQTLYIPGLELVLGRPSPSLAGGRYRVRLRRTTIIFSAAVVGKGFTRNIT